jgi:hypothetical protein
LLIVGGFAVPQVAGPAAMDSPNVAVVASNQEFNLSMRIPTTILLPDFTFSATFGDATKEDRVANYAAGYDFHVWTLTAYIHCDTTEDICYLLYPPCR